MRDATRPRPGTFCWPELATHDPPAAKGFYGDLFGWTAREAPAGPGSTYAIFQLRGRDAAALCPLAETRAGGDASPRWNSYVAVARADASAAKAKALGGTVLVEPLDVGANGRMAVVRDPQGATFCLWEAAAHGGIGVEGEIGSLCWTELSTTSLAAAERFYGELFGWTFQRSAGGDDSSDVAAGGTFIGSILATGRARAEAPPEWRPYFRVADCDVAVAKAKARGARVLAGPSDIPNLGRDALLAGPDGATFAVISFEAVA